MNLRLGRKLAPATIPLLLSLLLSACGGGGGGDASGQAAGTPAAVTPVVTPPATTTPVVTPVTPVTPPATTPVETRPVVTPPIVVTPPSVAITPAAAASFLARATFGADMASIDQVAAGGREAWISAQLALPQTLHRSYIDQYNAANAATPASANQVYESFWQQSATGSDQLRQRMAFALSEIFVLSMQGDAVRGYPRGVASYYDMLGKDAFGNFRDLLQDVALHPMMGIFLSHLRNQKESGTRVPDENFAREVMQLFTIGLYQLNQDGSLNLMSGSPIPTYKREDVSGMAKVFTGWSWAGPDKANNRFAGNPKDVDADWKPMQNYPTYHSTSEKTFLGTTISGATTGEADLKVALDALFNHQNVGPFIGRQLIQRLVTSNPSPAYVGRVAAAFANNGSGVRGDMRAVIRAVLLDREADTGSAKLREPIVRLANWMRAFNAKPPAARYRLYYLDDPLSGLGQSPLNASSVFNFFRPGYVPPNSALASAGMVAPEMQITAEPSVTGYVNYMQNAIGTGVGESSEIKADYSAEILLADQPEKLLDRVNLLLLGGAMSTTLRQQITAAVNSVALPAATTSNTAQVTTAKTNRAKLAIFLAMASPEYIVQK